jgi:hypothetical protein
MTNNEFINLAKWSSLHTFRSIDVISTIKSAPEAINMSDCMSIPPFDSDSILNWFSANSSPDARADAKNDSELAKLHASLGAGKVESAGLLNVPVSQPNSQCAESCLSQIPVLVGTDIVHLSVPIDLLCALLLTTGGNAPSAYSLHDVLLAGENLKRFREVSGSSPSTTASSHVARTPVTVQSEVQSASAEEIDIVSMSLDANGAALVQEMISKASALELDLIFDQLASTAVLISINTHGCRVMQRALEFGTPDQNYTLFKSIPAFKLVDLCIDVNGNHVMQKFVETLPQSALHDFVVIITDSSPDDFGGNGFSTVARLSLHSYGCRVIQRLLVRCTEVDRSAILNFVITTFPELVADQFGNYVAQHALEYSNDEERKSIIATLALMDIYVLCCNKFASNVVEKAVRIRLADKTVLHRLIATIIQSEEGLLSLMKDKYGNYVVKAICDLAATEFPEVLYVKNLLIAHSGTLKKYTYGYHLVEKLERSANGNRGRADSNLSHSSGERRARGYSRNL